MSPRIKVELPEATIEADVQVDDVGGGRWRAMGDVPDEDGKSHSLAAIGKSRGDAIGTWTGARIEREDGIRGKRKAKRR